MTDPFDALAAKEPNWDTYGAPPITPEAIAAARWLHRHWPTAAVVPTSAGGVQLETEALEIEIGPDGKIVGGTYTDETGHMTELEPQP